MRQLPFAGHSALLACLMESRPLAQLANPWFLTPQLKEPLRYRLGVTPGKDHNLLGWRGPKYNRAMLRPCAATQVQIEGAQCLTKGGGRWIVMEPSQNPYTGRGYRGYQFSCATDSRLRLPARSIDAANFSYYESTRLKQNSVIKPS